MKLAKNTVVSQRYSVKWSLRQVARGGFYQAADRERADERGLLKVCETDAFGTAFGQAGTWQERALFEKLDHQYIANLRDAGEWEHRGRSLGFMVFDWVSGENLATLLDRTHKLEVGQALDIVLALTDALQHLHAEENRFLALNLRPSCVWLDHGEQPNPVVVVLALAVPAGTTKLPECGGWEESVYLAPEVSNGAALVQGDVFSLAALLYRLLYGIPPWFVDNAPELFKQRKLASVLERQRSTPLNFDNLGHSLLDDHFKKTMRKALAVDYAARFQHVAEFRDALRRDRKVTTPVAGKNTSSVRPEIARSGQGFGDVAGMEALKAELRHDVIEALADRERYKKYGLNIPNGMLLYGPPGCGKTFIAKKFAEEIGCAVQHVTRSDVASIYVDGTVQKIRELFDAAREAAPSILFLDEFDSLVPGRTQEMHQTSKAEVNEFLAQLDGLSEHEVFVIAATNRPQMIDPAVLRSGRIDKKVFVPPPDAEARQAMFRLHLEGRHKEVGIDEGRLASLTENFVASDVKLIVDESARRALRENARISQVILEEVISAQRPSISTEMIAEYERLTRQFNDSGPGEDSASAGNRIGFM